MKNLLFTVSALALSIASGAAASDDAMKDLVAGEFDAGFTEGFDSVYLEHCVVCHGDKLQGSAQGPALAGVELKGGSSVDELIAKISDGVPARGMPAWRNILSDQHIQNVAIYIAEQRENLTYKDFHGKAEIVIPDSILESDLHSFGVEVVAKGIDPVVFSIEPMPDGRILVTERKIGISILEPGKEPVRVKGLPKIYSDVLVGGLIGAGNGQLLEVKLHPDYEKNGWIYMSYGDRCGDCNERSKESGMDVSMFQIIRGRLDGDRWVDQELIWSTDKEHYTSSPESGAGGRLAFDDQGHVFLTIGELNMPGLAEDGVQDLDKPYGKIFRVRDNGEIPSDNPFVDNESALPSLWTYGHRNPQGLAWDDRRKLLWSTEHGPRGGDEINLIKPGLNYGWPLVSDGSYYDGTKVDFGPVLGIEFDPDDLTYPEVNFTPSPAISSLIVYEGESFPNWQGDLIVTTLKAEKVMRVRPLSSGGYETETIINKIARIRDIELANDGGILLLLEHISGAVIVKLTPANTP